MYLGTFDLNRVERKTAELLGINSPVQERAQNREKTLVETTLVVFKGEPANYGICKITLTSAWFIMPWRGSTELVLSWGTRRTSDTLLK